MIDINELEVSGFGTAIRGMRNPMNSWDRMDSYYDPSGDIHIGSNDHQLMENLTRAGSEHRKFLRQISVSMDIIAPLYWWKEFDTYKIGTTTNSCSTMHKLHSRNLTLSDFSCEHLFLYTKEGEIHRDFKETLESLIDEINFARAQYVETNDKRWWWQMIQLLPSSYNQKRTVSTNYEVLLHIYQQRKGHKLDEWRLFCDYIEEKCPYSEFITLKFDDIKTGGQVETD